MIYTHVYIQNIFLLLTLTELTGGFSKRVQLYKEGIQATCGDLVLVSPKKWPLAESYWPNRQFKCQQKFRRLLTWKFYKVHKKPENVIFNTTFLQNFNINKTICNLIDPNLKKRELVVLEFKKFTTTKGGI